MIRIEPATREEHYAAIRSLLREYADSCPNDPTLIGIDTTLERLESGGNGLEERLLIAHQEQEAVGCIALQRLEEDACEMKRLYVSPRFRGLGIGRGLVMTLLIEAEKAGYRRMQLDIAASMAEAQGLYESIGFREITDQPTSIDGQTQLFELQFGVASAA